MENNKRSSVIWQKAALSALCVVLALILIAMIFVTAYANRLLGKLNRVPGGTDSTQTLNWNVPADETDPDSSNPSADAGDVTITTLPSGTIESQDGIINILLVGQDRRPGEPPQRSDSMILCSFNLNTNDITMISFLRDTYVQIPGYRAEKLNAAYAHGGFYCLNQTLAVNFGVHVDANIEVDFTGFTDIINLLGGVDISLTSAEVTYLKQMGYDVQVGTNHMDGKLALDYSRIRYIDSDAFRAGRQRTVLMALIEKYKNKSITEMLSILEEILPMITTDMSNDQIISYVWALFPMLSTADMGSQQIPANGTWTDMHVGDVRDAKVCDMEANRKILQGLLENP